MSQGHLFSLGILAVAVMAMLAGPATADNDKPVPRFEITPQVWLVGDRQLEIRVANLAPLQRVTVVSQTGTRVSQVARVEGVADDKGQFDLRGAHEPGPQTGAPFRILWDTKDDPTVEPVKEPSFIQFRAEVHGKVVATGTLRLDWGTTEGPTVTRKKVNDRGLHGELALPPGEGPFPGVLVLGGSEGGNSQRFKAAVLARHGFACLSVAYFDKAGVPGLPTQLIEIPLEYFETAVGYLKEHPQVRGDRLAVVGGSRGGEIALLLGSMFPDVKAVVAYAPSHVVWGGWPISAEDMKNKTNQPAWIYKGQPVPFMSRTLSPDEVKKLRGNDSLDRRPEFAYYLKDEKNLDMVRAATIPVEKIAGPILLISGTDDRLWPAAEMSEELMKRLAAKKHPFPASQHLSYELCGHGIRMPLLPVAFGRTIDPDTKEEFDHGGSAIANSYAAWDSWPKVVKFLGDSLK